MSTPVSCPEYTPNLTTKTSLGSLSQSATGLVTATTTPRDTYDHRDEPSSIREGYENIDSPTPTETSAVSYDYTPSPLAGDHKDSAPSSVATKTTHKSRNTHSAKLPPVSPAISSNFSNSVSSHVHHNSQPRVRLDISGQFPYFEEDPATHKPETVVPEEKQLEVLADDHAQPTPDAVADAEGKVSASTSAAMSATERTLRAHGFESGAFIAKTLQGSVCKGKRVADNKIVVIKRTSKKLHEQGITITKTGKKIKVQENIVAEATLLQRFSANGAPSSLIEYIAFFEDDSDYFLIMGHGGRDYFDFIVRQHERIVNGALSLSEWRKHCKFMFAQMVQFARWMQNVMSCCNMDISLENMLISEDAHYDADTQTLRKCHIKFIDFGLTEFFDGSGPEKWKCRKYVGKTHYKAPQVYAKRDIFSANKADVWSLGVCLFMMVIGAPPYNKPVDKDITFQYVKQQQIAKLLQEWGRIKYVTSNLHDLLTKMLTFDEDQRISLDEVVKHPWIRHYFPDENQPAQQPTPSKIGIPPQTPKSPPTRTKGSEPSTPCSPSVSMSMASGYAQTRQPLNIMIPAAQMSVSGSVMTPSVSSVNRRAGNGRYSSPRASARPYSPYSPTPYEPYSPQTRVQPMKPITPIIQSRTSKHDQAVFFCKVSERVTPGGIGDAMRTRAQSDVTGGSTSKKAHTNLLKNGSGSSGNLLKKGKKRKKLFGRVSLPLFGGH